MEIMKLEFGIERVWSDNDALSWGGFKAMPDGAASSGHQSIPGENVTIGGCIERIWSNADALVNIQSPRLLKKAA